MCLYQRQIDFDSLKCICTNTLIKKGVKNYQLNIRDEEVIFVEKELLNLTPRRYLCPYCGKWHEWKEKTKNLRKAGCFACEFIADGGWQVQFEDDDCFYANNYLLCERAGVIFTGDIAIDSITESVDKPIVTFKVPVELRETVGTVACRHCNFVDDCNIVNLSDRHKKNIEITLGFEFTWADYEKIVKANNCVTQEIKEETTMANNIFNMNLEFGPNKDENISSTLMGIAVKNGDSWRIYDKKKHEITDVGDLRLGNLPIFVLPTAKLSEGDLIKDDGEYYFVMKVEAGSTQTLCAKTGEMKEVIPIKNILGFSCYSKVIALSDYLNMESDFDVEKMAIMSALCGQTAGEDGGQMNQLLPLMIFKDKLGTEDDVIKVMLMSSVIGNPVAGCEQNTGMNQLLPLMFLKDKSGDDETMKMMLMSSAMGNNSMGTNPLMGYLMYDTLFGKKNREIPEKNVPEQIVQKPTEEPTEEPTE